jgi:hypothetical protein
MAKTQTKKNASHFGGRPPIDVIIDAVQSCIPHPDDSDNDDHDNGNEYSINDDDGRYNQRNALRDVAAAGGEEGASPRATELDGALRGDSKA